jgi:hypothetical protein
LHQIQIPSPTGGNKEKVGRKAVYIYVCVPLQNFKWELNGKTRKKKKGAFPALFPRSTCAVFLLTHGNSHLCKQVSLLKNRFFFFLKETRSEKTEKKNITANHVKHRQKQLVIIIANAKSHTSHHISGFLRFIGTSSFTLFCQKQPERERS